MGLFSIFKKKETDSKSNAGNGQNSVETIVKLARAAGPESIHSEEGCHEAARLIELVIPAFGVMSNVSPNSFITASMLDGNPQAQLARVHSVSTEDLISLFRVIGILAGEDSNQNNTMVYSAFQNAIINELKTRKL